MSTKGPAVPFWSRVDRSGGATACWPWTGPTNRRGYGVVNKCSHGVYLAHRYALATKVGNITKHQYACHTCDNPTCCNPAHLYVGTQHNNMQDMVTRGRAGKLTSEARAGIRFLVQLGHTQQDVARVYNVTQTCVSGVVRGVTWRNL